MEDVSAVALLGRLVVSMAVVLGLMVLAGRVARRRGLGGATTGSSTARIDVVARQSLGRGSSVQLVRVGGRSLVLGVTETSVQVLGEADAFALEAEQLLSAPAPDLPAPRPGWGPLLEALRERTVRT